MALFSCCTDFKGPAHPLCILAWPVPLQNYFSEITNQFYNWQGSLDGGLAGRKATTYTGQYHRNIKTYIHAMSRIRTHDLSDQALSLRPRSPWDRPVITIPFPSFFSCETNSVRCAAMRAWEVVSCAGVIQSALLQVCLVQLCSFKMQVVDFIWIRI
jgi:hypothetical protein